jgi:hypothetical protein
VKANKNGALVLLLVACFIAMSTLANAENVKVIGKKIIINLDLTNIQDVKEQKNYSKESGAVENVVTFKVNGTTCGIGVEYNVSKKDQNLSQEVLDVMTAKTGTTASRLFNYSGEAILVAETLTGKGKLLYTTQFRPRKDDTDNAISVMATPYEFLQILKGLENGGIRYCEEGAFMSSS